MMLFKNNKRNFIIWGIIIVAIIAVTVFSFVAMDFYNNIEVWERSNNNFLDETIIFDEEQVVDNIEESESTESNAENNSDEDNEQEIELEITQNKSGVTDEIDSIEESEEKKEEKEEYSCTIEVRCDKILDNLEKLSKGKKDLISADGVILDKKEVGFNKGENVFDILLRVLKESKIHMEFVKTPATDNVYIEGINNIYEFDCGELSGWMYKVNGKFPNYGCGKYYLEKGDTVEFIYTCDLGRDIGGAYINQK